VALLVMIGRKMAKNLWLELSLLFGLILSVGLVSSMPIYTEAVLQRMLIKDLENLQQSSGQYPGVLWASGYLDVDMKPEDTKKLMEQLDAYMERTVAPSFGLPLHHFVKERATDRFRFVPEDPTRIDPSVQRVADISAMSGLEEHIRLVDGRLPSKEPVDGVYEALVVENALSNLKMVLGNVFVIKDDAVKKTIKIKPVGVFDVKESQDLYWYASSLGSYNGTFFIPFELFGRDFDTSTAVPVRSGSWYMALDYSRMELDGVEKFLNGQARTEQVFSNNFINYSVKAPAVKTIGQYFEREANLRKLLWSLNVPVMIMLGFYLYMVSNLITDRQKTEIAVLRSRGASRLQVLTGYLLEGLLLGSIAFAIGPWIGAMLTRGLGASNGFLEFVQRSALDVDVGAAAYKYAAYAVVCSLVMTLLPAFLATRTNIVGHKQQMARRQKRSFWHKFFLDFVLVGVAVYMLYNFERQRKDFVSLGVDSSSLSVDPMLFLVPALFILGFGLILLRVYPYVIRFLYWLGRKWWPPALYSTLIQVGRSSSQYQFLMIFLIMTIATGLFGASAARTLNKNTEDKILYKNGTDLVLKLRWEDDAPPPSMGSGPEGGTPSGSDPVIRPKRIQYMEPPFQPLTQLPGVEQAAKVFVKKDAGFYAGKETGSVTLMGIQTDDFGRAAWFRDHLLEYHFYDYLNLLSTNPGAVLISRTMAEQKGIKAGDPIFLGWSGVENRTFTVYGIIDYWPTFNPNPTVRASGGKAPPAPMLVVGHLEHMQNVFALEPYEVWIKLKEGASRQEFVNALEAGGIPVVSMTDTREELIRAKNDPFQLAINGVMTLGFLISIIISFFGFLLYWVLSLHSRILQLGIFRAMGISFRQLVGMLIAEQLLTSGAAILIGVLTGNLTSHLFVRLFQLSFDPATQVPPFQITFDPRDSMSLYTVVTLMIALGLFILGWMLSRIKIHQAVKLGEDG